MVRGSTPADVTPTIRTSGISSFFLTKSSLAITRAAAPSVMPEEFAAVTVPVFENTGGNFAMFSMVAPIKGCSSRENTVLPFLPSIVTGTISSLNRSELIAFAARVCEHSPYWSCSSREILYCCARISAVSPITILAIGQMNPSRYMPSTSSWLPIR